MTDDIRVIVGGDAGGLNKTLADSTRLVANARAQVNAELAKLDAKVAESQSKLGGFTKVFGALLAGVSIGAITGFAKGAIEAAGSVGELAEQVGTTTDELQTLQYWAVQNNLSTDKLEKGVATLSRTMGQAADHSDDAIRKFRDLGVGVLDPLTGKIRNTSAVLEDVAKAIMALDDPQARIAASSSIFGDKLGSRMLPLLSKLAEGLGQATAEAKAAGAVLDADLINRMDRLSDRMAANARAMDAWAARVVDGFARGVKAAHDYAAKAGNLQAPTPTKPNRGKNTTLGLGQEQGGALGGGAEAPAPDQGTPAPDGGSGASGGAGGPAVGASSGTLPEGEAERKRAAEVQNLIAALRQEREEIGKTDDEILRLKLSSELDVEQTAKRGVAVRKYTDAQVDAVVAEKQRTMSAKELLVATTAQEEQDARLRQLEGTQARNLQQMGEQVVAARQSTVVFNALTGAYEVYDRELRITAESQRLMNEYQGLSAEKARELASATVDAADALRKANQGAERDVQRMNAAQQELESFGEKSFDRLGDAAVIFGQKGSGAFADLGNAASAFFIELQSEFLKLAALNPLKNALFGSNLPTLNDVGGIFGRMLGGGGGDFSGMTGAVGAEGLFFADGGIMTSRGRVPLNRYAGGGVANRPQVAMFGEGRVPEAYVPLPDGKRIPVVMSGANDNGGVRVEIYDQRSGGAPVETQTSRDNNGNTVIRNFIRDEQNRNVANGALDQTNAASYGLKRRATNRG